MTLRRWRPNFSYTYWWLPLKAAEVASSLEPKMSQVLKLNENEGVLCLESAQQLVNFSIVSRWIALTSQNRLVIFDGSGSSGSELIYDTTNDGPDKGKKEKSLIQKAITRSRTASSDCGDEPPKKLRIVPPNVETINELGNTNYDEHEMRSRKSTVSYQEYTNAECEVENYNIVDPAYEADISFEQMERMRITKDMSPKLADTDVITY